MTKSLPDEFPPAHRSYSLYEDISYQDYWENPDLTDQDALEQHLVSLMLPPSGTRIIDIGGGYGRLAPCYVDRFRETVICDGSMSLLGDARRRYGNRVTTIAADISRLPFADAAFDCALSIRVLQHCHDLEAAFAEIGRIVADDGTLVFSYHNKRNANRMLRYFAARGDANPFSHAPTEVRATLISRHPRVVDGLIGDNGFSPAEYHGTAIVNWLSPLMKAAGGSKPVGARWARAVGALRLAPWLVGKSTASGSGALDSEASIVDLLRCPVCHGNLNRSHSAFECPACSREYPVREDTLDFRV